MTKPRMSYSDYQNTPEQSFQLMHNHIRRERNKTARKVMVLALVAVFAAIALVMW